ncbi:MAG: hypothetical protein OYH76_23315 [Defluviicoccus sp.]|nr:hypothetical protein [Defluviicoccus sp.]MDE0278835.1 hypothetical protein [Defluviicoccus sp.]
MAENADKAPKAKPAKSERLFPVTRPEDVFGSLPYDGPTKSIEEMDAAVLEEAKRRHDRS